MSHYDLVILDGTATGMLGGELARGPQEAGSRNTTTPHPVRMEELVCGYGGALKPVHIIPRQLRPICRALISCCTSADQFEGVLIFRVRLVRTIGAAAVGAAGALVTVSTF